MSAIGKHAIAVLIPCLNEGPTIAQVVRDCREVLPGAQVYVYDNGSTDNSVEVAANAGAKVCHERLRGKGNVVRRMLGEIKADVYILVDGDNTYDLSGAPALVQTLLNGGYDMVTTARMAEPGALSFYDRFGIKLLSWLVSLVFQTRMRDVLSSYRLFSRRFVESFSGVSHGFEIETELNLHALELKMPIKEASVLYRQRPHGSKSKFRTVTDGLRILLTIVSYVKRDRPLRFFSFLSFLLMPLSAVLALSGILPRLSFLSIGSDVLLLAVLIFTFGLVFERSARRRRELKRISQSTTHPSDL
jgi:glycosyltransferase involved in cell wall biosynthesis